MKTLTLFLAMASVALASHPCNSTVNVAVDGVDTRAIVLQNFSEPTLDAWKVATLAQCPDWQSADNAQRFKNNLLVAVVTIDQRKVGLYYGDSLRPLLDGQEARIRTQVMSPKFRDRDYVGGLEAGIREIQRLYTAAQSTASATVVVNQPAAPSEPTDFTGLWWVLGGIVLIVGTLYGLSKLGAWLRYKAEEREKRNGAQQSAMIACQEATSLISKLSVEEQEKAKDAISTYGQLGYGVTDPRVGGLTAEQYRAIETAYRDVSRDVRAAMYETKIDPFYSKPVTASAPKSATALYTADKSRKVVLKKKKTEPKVESDTVVESHTTIYTPGPSTVVVPVPVPVVEDYAPSWPSVPSVKSDLDPAPSRSSWGSSSESSSGSSSSWSSSDSSSSYGSSSDSSSFSDSGSSSGGGDSGW